MIAGATTSARDRQRPQNVMCRTYPGTVNVPDDFPLARELAAFEEHRQEFMSRAAGRYALVHGDELAGEYDTEGDAIKDGYSRFGNVPFLVKKIEPFDLPQSFGPYLTAV